jgi:transcriptional regulator with PAS, ATPase and Fis domain
MRVGAFDVIQKSADFSDVQIRLQKAMEMASLKRRLRYLAQTDGEHREIIGDSPTLLCVRQRIEEVARTPASTVLVTGETGTGKELVARAIHRRSSRQAMPMITVNCAAIPESLLESEFFGYERGAFTGADHSKTGLFETADGGSLFLDEIGELDLKLQAKFAVPAECISHRCPASSRPGR